MPWYNLILVFMLICTSFAQAGDSTSSTPQHLVSSDGKGTLSQNSKKEKEEKEEKEEKKNADFDIPVVEGSPVYGLKFPYRDENDRVVMFETKMANKIDGDHVDMQELKIDAYDDDGKKIYIELPHAILNIETRILTGDPRALIRREDFEITGNTIEFNMKTRHTKIRGNIKMTIFTADNS